jgi:hypothetical protein
MLLRQLPDETIEAVEETNSRDSRRDTETCVRDIPPTNFGGRDMTTKSSFAKYLVIRIAAFVGLTAASTAVMALPYLA